MGFELGELFKVVINNADYTDYTDYADFLKLARSQNSSPRYFLNSHQYLRENEFTSIWA